MSTTRLMQLSKKTLHELYIAAIQFKSVAPWRWMWDSNVICVQNPAGDEDGYCVVLGRNGEFFGLDVCLGEEGLEDYFQMQSRIISPDDMDAVHTKNCLLASFEDRKYLEKEDLKAIKEVGLTFRGRDAWPKFRRYEPGFFPWYISEAQAIFLTHCLQQVLDVAIKFKDNSDLLEPKGKNGYFTRVCEKKGKNVVWHDAWIKSKALRKVVVVRNDVDEEKISRVFDAAERTSMVWQADYFWAPMPVREGKGRPYFPVMYMLSDQESYFIFDTQFEQKNNYGNSMGDALIRAIEKHGIYPKKIVFQKPEVGLALGYFGKKFDIKIERVNQLKAIDDARRGAFDFFRK